MTIQARPLGAVSTAWLRAAAVAVVLLGSTAAAWAQNSNGQGNNQGGNSQGGNSQGNASGTYLALGDSVVFGYIRPNGYAQLNPDNFLGYPFWLGQELNLKVVNAACPGETSGSFLSPTAPDAGCRAYRAGPIPGIGPYPLHVAYTGPQHDFAMQYLHTHNDVKLVTVMLGANDLYLLQGPPCNGDPTCITNGLPTTLATLGANMTAILYDLRHTAGYKGPIVVVNYYSTDYTDLVVVTPAVAAMNQVLATVARAFGASVADSFSAFQVAASTPYAGGETCKTALLNVSPTNPATACDDHPSQSGQRLLAATVAAALAGF